MGYSAKAVANYFLSKYGKHGITPLKIQKLVYIAHGWYMAFHDDHPLIDDEWAEAWQYGPVFASLYHEFKYRGKSPIIDLATELDTSGSKMKWKTPKLRLADKQTRKFLDKVWEIYGKYSGIRLSKMCHKSGSPWHDTWVNAKGRKNTNIEDDLISNYYKDLLGEHRKKIGMERNG